MSQFSLSLANYRRAQCLGSVSESRLHISTSSPFLTIIRCILLTEQKQVHKIKGSAVGNQKEALEVLDMASRGIVKTHYRLEKMENLTDVFQQMSEGKMVGRVVLDLQ
jgi:D-arabinose 1-dehydrogenase-like Zn-dependent alcohol dehydrogenase